MLRFYGSLSPVILIQRKSSGLDSHQKDQRLLLHINPGSSGGKTIVPLCLGMESSVMLDWDFELISIYVQFLSHVIRIAHFVGLVSIWSLNVDHLYSLGYYGCDSDLIFWVFRHLRELFQVDPADYMLAICGNDALRELSSPGKSGSFFYLTQDDRFMIKTVKKSEVKVSCLRFRLVLWPLRSSWSKNIRITQMAKFHCLFHGLYLTFLKRK